MVNMFVEATNKVDSALKLLDQKTADRIIGSTNEDYKKLINGIEGIHLMFWQMALTNGMKKNRHTLKMAAQALTVMLSLIHYAYALGVRRGRDDNASDL